MVEHVTADTLHRTAKYFMDTGQAVSHRDAMRLLEDFGIHIEVGEEARTSRNHQIAVLTLINAARRTFLGGVQVRGIRKGPLLAPLADAQGFTDAVEQLGGRIVERANSEWPSALIGTADQSGETNHSWQLTWDGWRGGVLPAKEPNRRLPENSLCSLAPAVAAAACATEAFLLLAGDHPMAGKRAAGVSLWSPTADWLSADNTEPPLSFLPSRLWMIGLGNLGQSCLWLLACLPYAAPAHVELLLQDFDRIVPSNESTSLLSTASLVGQMKTRGIAHWLEQRGFRATIEERRFGEWIHRNKFDPGVALCGVDNPEARRSLERAGFGLVVEAGLGSGPQACKNFSMHTFPSSFHAAELWREDGAGDGTVGSMPAYEPGKHPELDQCGLTQLASRSVGIPFVSLTAGAFMLAEILRRLNGGHAFELVSGSLSSLGDIEVSRCESGSYAWGHVPAAPL
jgi:hypothetical protein